MNSAVALQDPSLQRNRQAYAGLAELLEAAGLAEHALYLNWGYRPVAGLADQAARQVAAGEPGADQARLVLEVLGQLPVDGCQVLDVGCGRGGALALMAQHYRPRTLTGIDLSAANIAYCRNRHRHARLRLQIADACQLPVPGNSVDLLLNLESSGAYSDLPAFFGHAWRVLREGGHFCYADVFDAASLAPIRSALAQCGFELLSERSVAAQVVAARQAAPPQVALRLRQVLTEHDNPELRAELERFLAEPGSSLFQALTDGRADYRVLHLRKRAQAGAVDATVARALAGRSARLDAAFGGSASSPWLPFGQPDRSQGHPVFALPYAGGGASVYRHWQLENSAWRIHPVQLPGREGRIAEPGIDDMATLVQQLVELIEPWADQPWALLGCSLGCKVAFEVARALSARGRPPRLLFLMACPAPSLPLLRKVSSYDEAQFAAEVRHLGGTPEAVLADEQMMRTLAPILRNDSALAEGYCADAAAQVHNPLVMVAASDDHLVPLEAARLWRRHAGAGFDWRQVDGGHFFLRERRAELLGWLGEALQHSLNTNEIEHER
ncbi:methyltransferase domain-containing protein [Pantoea sp. Tr-811]|uniref:alpha/beta fold hydrolase n=1 Tax=Pantoea sp. Tr-811 TaxID=2608361 RepID=UPI0014223F07|nr:alpha/beta fold hydrolase [Pantoea sp. Tr-811]NIF29093.1 methyltransferase domain-containing protein [Pantoea sp. Tr-811]